MDWSFLGRPEFVGPASGLVGVLIGSGMSAWTTRRTHSERLKFDRKLAERKFEFDKNLAERRINGEIGLAEKKIALRKRLAPAQLHH